MYIHIYIIGAAGELSAPTDPLRQDLQLPAGLEDLIRCWFNDLLTFRTAAFACPENAKEIII